VDGQLTMRALAKAVAPAALALRSAKVDLCLIGVFSALALAHAWLHRFASIDDAYITYRYARNLGDGLGLVFNPNERVEGTSSLLFTIILAAAYRTGLDMELTAKVVGTAGYVGVVVLAYAFLRRSLQGRFSRAYAGLGAALTLSFTPLAFHAVAGMELDVYTALLLAGVLGYVRSRETARASGAWALWLALAAITRSEALGLLSILLATSFIQSAFGASTRWNRSNTADRCRCSATELLWASAVLLPVELFRRLYFGAWLPNSVLAKNGYVTQLLGLPFTDALVRLRDSSGAQQLGQFCMERLGWAPLVALLALALPRHRRKAVTLLLCFVFVAGVFLANDGDWMPHARLLAPALPVVAVGTVLGVAAAHELLARRSARAACAVPPLAAVMSIHQGAASFYERQPLGEPNPVALHMKALGLALADVSLPSDLLATDMAGRVPYFSGMRTLDTFGLCDAHIARTGSPVFCMGKVDWPYVFRRQPDYYFYNFGENARAMWDNPAFGPYRSQYLLVETAFYRSHPYGERKVLLVRDGHPRVHGLAHSLRARLVSSWQLSVSPE
jgi:arabinofuranosyltransferase